MNELEYIQEKIRSNMNDVADHLATGGCQSWEHYQYMIGMVKAFAIIERDVVDLVERIKSE
jgi:hypothetical protein